MHNKIVQKCAPLIYGFSAFNIYEVSYVEQKLKEIKSAFNWCLYATRDIPMNVPFTFCNKQPKHQVKTEVNDDVKGGAKGRKKK